MRAPVETIPAPPFPPGLEWVNVASVQFDQQRGRPLLVEFWDFCRPNSIRTLPYVKAWHADYARAGLCVVSVHCPGFAPARDASAVRDAVARLGIEHPVLIDTEFELWREYGNAGWPARYLFDGERMLFDYHYGEGGYDDTELAIQELLGVQREPLAPLRAEDAPGAQLAAPSGDESGPWVGPGRAWSGRYDAGGVWAVLEGDGCAHANGRELQVAHPGCYPLIEHDRHTAGELELELSDGVTCHAVCFTPGVAA